MGARLNGIIFGDLEWP